MSEDREELVLEISDEDLAYMLSEGLAEKNDKGEFWLTTKGEQFVRDYMDGTIGEEQGDAE